jgi:hypothetical protein
MRLLRGPRRLTLRRLPRLVRPVPMMIVLGGSKRRGSKEQRKNSDADYADLFHLGKLLFS